MGNAVDGLTSSLPQLQSLVSYSNSVEEKQWISLLSGFPWCVVSWIKKQTYVQSMIIDLTLVGSFQKKGVLGQRSVDMVVRCVVCDAAIGHTKDEYYALVKFEPKVYTEFIESQPREAFCSYLCLLHYVVRMK